MQDLTVDLVRLDGQWQIDSIQKGSPLTPDGAVWLFYNEYLARLVQSGAPLADKAYPPAPTSARPSPTGSKP